MPGRTGGNGDAGDPWVPTNGRMLTVGQAAHLLNAHPNSVRRWADMGLLPSYRIGCRGDRRFTRKDISHFMASQEEYSGRQGQG